MVSRSTSRWPRRCSTSTSTSTTRCGTGDDDPQWIRSFRPGDYLVLTVANGESLVVSRAIRPSAARSSFFARRHGPPRPRRRSALRRRRRAASPTSTHLPTSSATSPPGCPTADTFESIFAEHQLAVGQVRQPGELTETEWAAERGVVVDIDDRAGGSIRVPNVPWRFSDAPDVAVSGMREVPRRGQPHRAPRPARLRRRQARRPRGRAACCRAACPRPALSVNLFPVVPDEGDDDLAARRETTGRTRSSGTATARSSTSRPGRVRLQSSAGHDVTAR